MKKFIPILLLAALIFVAYFITYWLIPEQKEWVKGLILAGISVLLFAGYDALAKDRKASGAKSDLWNVNMLS